MARGCGGVAERLEMLRKLDSSWNQRAVWQTVLRVLVLLPSVLTAESAARPHFSLSVPGVETLSHNVVYLLF